MGPWTRLGRPLLPVRPGSFDGSGTTNPSVCRLPDGRFCMIYKCWADPAPFNGHVTHGIAFADSPKGPFIRCKEPVFREEKVLFAAEDPCCFIWQGKLQCIMKDMKSYYVPDESRALIRFVSDDLGETWRKADPFVFHTRTVDFEQGGKKEIFRLERPFLYLEKGVPKVFFTAAKFEEGLECAANLHMKAEFY